MTIAYRVGRIALVAILLVMAACGGSRLAPPSGDVVPDPDGFARSLRAATLPVSPLRYTFDWRLNEQGSVVNGRGVVRTEAPSRIRLDLFGARGDTYLIAALVNGEYRLPPEAANAVALPSPALLWAALGVLEPPPNSVLSSATTSGETAELRYAQAGDQVFAYTFNRGPDQTYRISRLERAGPRGVLETVSIDRSSDGTIEVTRYRDWSAFRDLEFSVEETRAEPSFPSDIWSPDGASR